MRMVANIAIIEHILTRIGLYSNEFTNAAKGIPEANEEGKHAALRQSRLELV